MRIPVLREWITFFAVEIVFKIFESPQKWVFGSKRNIFPSVVLYDLNKNHFAVKPRLSWDLWGGYSRLFAVSGTFHFPLFLVSKYSDLFYDSFNVTHSIWLIQYDSFNMTFILTSKLYFLTYRWDRSFSFEFSYLLRRENRNWNPGPTYIQN